MAKIVDKSNNKYKASKEWSISDGNPNNFFQKMFINDTNSSLYISSSEIRSFTKYIDLLIIPFF